MREIQDLRQRIDNLHEENSAVLAREQELHHYIREKTNQLLKVMGTLPLRPEELDDETLLAVDPIGIISDSFGQILEHLHQTNENLSLAKDEIQAIFDTAGAGILVVDSEMRLLAHNHKSQTLFFQTTPDPQLKTCCSLVCKRDNPPEDCTFNQVLAGGRTYENSDFINGERSFHVIGTPIKNQVGDVTHVILVFTDITERMKNELELHEARAQLDAILNNTQAGILLIDPETHHIVFANQATINMTGISRERLIGANCQSVICPTETGHCPITDDHQEIDNAERKVVTIDGRTIPVIKTVGKIEINGKEHLLESFINISERKAAEEKLRTSEERYRTLFSTMLEGVAQNRLIYDADGRPCDYEILDINPAYEKIVGLKRKQVIGRLASEIYPLSDGKPACLDEFAEVVVSGKPVNFEFTFEPLGRVLQVAGAPLGSGLFSSVCEDISERKQNAEKIERLAYFCNLTGLPNRVLMHDRLSQMVARAKRSNHRFGLFFLDLDHFKRVNDTLGHDSGDQLLKVMADRLQRVLRSCDTICRLGGDEFVILVDDIKDRDGAAMIACKMIEALSRQIILKNKEIYTSTSIGIGIFPEDGDDPDTLLKNADTAMYRAKEEGRNTYRFYSWEMNSQALEQMLLANDLRKALERNEFYLEYQPQIDLQHGQLIGVEALLRWQHAELGNVPPNKFIPLAEETGQILTIGQWVLETACKEVSRLQHQCNVPLRVAVNLSTKQFQDPAMVSSVQNALKTAGLAAEHLELEITESLLMENIENAKNNLYQLKKMGVKLAIDDFGTGYSSLSYLRHFPIDRLKVDRSFIQRISSHPDDATITETIIVMGHTMGIEVVAEGVEEKDELTFLKQKHCDAAQGNYFSRPLLPETLKEKILHPASFCFFGN